MSQPEGELATDSGETSLDDIASEMEETEEEVDESEDTESEAEEVEESEEDEDEETESATDDELQFELDGKPVKVKRSQLPELYRNQMLDADYRQKTAALAEQRRFVESHAQAIAQERQQAAAQLETLIGGLYQELVGTQPDQSLIESDPQEYLRQTAIHNQRAAQMQQAFQQREALQGRMTADQQRQQALYRQQASEQLLEMLPAWKDTKIREKESLEVAGYLRELGYTPTELNDLVDPRALLVARDAAKFRQMQAARAKQGPKEPPRVMRPGAAPAPSKGNQARVQAARDNARANPDSLEALAKLADASGI